LAGLAHTQPFVPSCASSSFLLQLCCPTCEKVAENGAFGELFSATLPPQPNPPSGCFNLFLGFPRQAPNFEPPQQTCSCFRHPFCTPPLPSFRATYFGTTSSAPKMGPLRSTLPVMARGIYGTVFPPSLHPFPSPVVLPRRPPASSISVLHLHHQHKYHCTCTISTIILHLHLHHQHKHHPPPPSIIMTPKHERPVSFHTDDPVIIQQKRQRLVQ
jgi:hypothetical protein